MDFLWKIGIKYAKYTWVTSDKMVDLFYAYKNVLEVSLVAYCIMAIEWKKCSGERYALSELKDGFEVASRFNLPYKMCYFHLLS